jgi:hypothetical protein
MKQVFSASVLIEATLVAGCISQQHGLVIEPIGPPNVQLAHPGSNGTLVIFSAFDPHADFNDLPSLRHYTDYKITSADGTLQQTVHNNNGLLVEGPKKLELPVGTYRVMAHANGYGMVTVPVVIRANQVTTVHLEGGASWPNNAALLGSNDPADQVDCGAGADRHGQRGQVRAPSSGSEPKPTQNRKRPRTKRPARIPIYGWSPPTKRLSLPAAFARTRENCKMSSIVAPLLRNS